MTHAWLRLVNEKAFEVLKQSAAADGGAEAGLPIEGIPVDFSGYFKGDWEDFQERRREYFSQEESSMTESSAVAVFRQSLSDKQLETWLACMNGDPVGAFFALSDDSEATVTATLRYRGIPGSNLKFDIEIVHGQYQGRSQFSRVLAHDATFGFIIKRTSPPRTVVVNATSEAFTDSAVAIWPPPPIERRVTFGAINANQFSVGLNVTDDREISPKRLFVRALSTDLPARFYVPSGGAPGGLSPTSTLFLNYSSAVDTEIQVAVVGDEETAKLVRPSATVALKSTGDHAGWDTRANAALGTFPTREGVNYIVIAVDSGAKLPLINGFWFVGR